MNEKKVVAFIVEGPSDEAALGSVMKEHFSSNEVQFIVLRKKSSVHGIPYKIYYNSCNLEHVLYGELREYTDEEKQILSDDFADKYEGKAEEFIAFLSDPAIAVAGTYQKTWDYIEEDKNSLKRCSNMHLLFDTERGRVHP